MGQPRQCSGSQFQRVMRSPCPGPKPSGRHAGVNRQRAPLFVQEKQVQRKRDADGVDGSDLRQPDARAGRQRAQAEHAASFAPKTVQPRDMGQDNVCRDMAEVKRRGIGFLHGGFHSSCSLFYAGKQRQGAISYNIESRVLTARGMYDNIEQQWQQRPLRRWLRFLLQDPRRRHCRAGERTRR